MQHFLVNNGIYIDFCLIMGRINTIVFLNKYKIMMCIWNYILLHRMDQNDRQSRIKLCAQRIMCPTTNWVGNCIIVMVWIGLLPICVSIIFCSIGVQFLSRVGNFLYIVNFQILCWFQFDSFENVSMLMIFERFMYNL
jgi:hypothetical protein